MWLVFLVCQNIQLYVLNMVKYLQNNSKGHLNNSNSMDQSFHSTVKIYISELTAVDYISKNVYSNNVVWLWLTFVFILL